MLGYMLGAQGRAPLRIGGGLRDELTFKGPLENGLPQPPGTRQGLIDFSGEEGKWAKQPGTRTKRGIRSCAQD